MLKARNESVYIFHVVLVHRDNIYDFDYLNSPTVLTTSEYFKRQIRGGPDSNLIVKPIPADDYLKEYSSSVFDEKNYYYYLLPEYEVYTELVLSDYLRR